MSCDLFRFQRPSKTPSSAMVGAGGVSCAELTAPLVAMGAPVVLLMALSRLSRLSRCVPAAGFVDFNLHNRILEAHKSLETHEDADAPSACCSCRFEHLCTYAYCVPLCMLSVTLCLDAGIW